jgi:DNA-binding transcriptional LysR family regulator
MRNEHVDHAVLERSSGGVRVTPAGRYFLRVARSIVEQLDALAATTRASAVGAKLADSRLASVHLSRRAI